MSLEKSAPRHEPSAVGYERRDVAWPTVLWVTAATIAIVVVFVVAAAGLYALLARNVHPGPSKATAPLLDSAQQLHQLRQREDQRLNSSGWVSREDRIVRVPIDRAIDLWVEEQKKP